VSLIIKQQEMFDTANCGLQPLLHRGRESSESSFTTHANGHRIDATMMDGSGSSASAH
jgi:hypothetical protein